MPDDFEALRTIRAPLGELDAERAARMRARALAGVLQDRPGSTLIDDQPTGRGRTDGAGARDGDAYGRPERALDLVGPADDDRRWEPAGGSRGTPGRSPRRSFVVVVATAAAILAVVIGLGATRSSDQVAVVGDQPRPTSVADIAANAATLADRPVRPGEFAHIRTEQGVPTTATDGTPQVQVRTRETWSNSVGVGRERYSATEILDDQRQPVGIVEPARVDEYPSGAPAFGSFGYDALRAMPADPDRLLAVLTEGTFGPADDAALHRYIADLLALDSTPPAVRAAALGILADRGATLLDEATDTAGRTGIGIVSSRPDGITTVFVVTRDGLLLGAYDVASGGPTDPAVATRWTTLQLQDRVAALD